MTSDDLRSKLDARGRRALDRNDLPDKVEVLVRTKRSLSEQEKLALDRAGCKIYFATGNVVTGSVESSHLEELASLPFVRRIEVSRPLYEEAKGDPEEE